MATPTSSAALPAIVEVPPESHSNTPAGSARPAQAPVSTTERPQPSLNDNRPRRRRGKPRPWCYDCRRRGHDYQQCAQPIGEPFCGQCGFRFLAVDVCPTH
uniref:Uncharacterized protein n=1 Tax=Bracon brevicornis TaxID=1563983 RepID=A0A6V7ILN7_9HYME